MAVMLRNTVLKGVLLCIPVAALWAQLQPGNFTIYAEPTAKVQTDAPVPYQIRVTDDRNKPVVDAKVTLQIETEDHLNVQVFKAPAVDKGLYEAKPVFPKPGTWHIFVHVLRNNLEGARTYDVNVPRTTE